MEGFNVKLLFLYFSLLHVSFSIFTLKQTIQNNIRCSQFGKKCTQVWLAHLLGGLLFFFGLNQMILFDKLAIYIIAALSLFLFGLYVLIFNYRAYKHYKQFVEEEAK